MMMRYVLVSLLAAASLVGCERSPVTAQMPEVNDENCKTERVLKMEPEALRQEFGSRCFRRYSGPTELPSNPKRW